MTSLMIVDDHVLLGQVLADGLRGRGYDVVIADLSAPILDQVTEHRPDVVLVDLELGAGVRPGSELVAPVVSMGSLVVVLTGAENELILASCLELGAAGVLPKNTPFDELIEQLDAGVGSGELAPLATERLRLLQLLHAHRRTQAGLLEPFGELTEREADVLRALMDGLSATEISETSFVAVSTVRSHVKSILRKLNVSSQLQAVARAHEVGWPHAILGGERRRAS